MRRLSAPHPTPPSHTVARLPGHVQGVADIGHITKAFTGVMNQPACHPLCLIIATSKHASLIHQQNAPRLSPPHAQPRVLRPTPRAALGSKAFPSAHCHEITMRSPLGQLETRCGLHSTYLASRPSFVNRCHSYELRNDVLLPAV